MESRAAAPESGVVIEGPGDEAGYAVKLQAFEGPLDLLLHLIRLNEVDIHDIPIARIAEQYLEYLDLLRDLNIDVASEYLLMAATLAWIKSRMLLPPDGTEEGAEEGPDPRAELVARLLEYQRFREAAHELDGVWRLDRDVFAAQCPKPEAVPDAEREIEVGLFELVEALRSVLAHAPATGAAHELAVETITVRERMLAVMEALEQAPSLEFLQIFEPPDGRPPHRSMIVATFLAVLELVRLAAIRVYQGLDAAGVPTGPIRLRAGADVEDANWRERISELM
ncbi:MAG: segregation/condensation protein A [Deltaproteobacteria bacterium]|nr:MAG: segregation/condensation protein A [Deltaproteobacteria bacterium]